MARSRTAHLVRPIEDVMLDATKIWAPQAGPQMLATLCPVKMILFGGSRGGGKTDCAIGKQIYGALRYGPDWNGLFIRKSYKYFADIRRRLGQLIRAGLPAELVGPQQGTNYLRFKSGANITLTVVESIEKAEFFQGQSFTSVSIEEACQFSYIDAMIEMLKGCLRSAAGIPTQMFLTANPGGPGHSQVKARFMPKGVKPGQIVTDDTGMTSVFIPSSVEDNKILCENDPDYVNNLRSIKDPALRKAWLEGDWDVVLGGFFGDVWNPYKHVVPQFRPPMHWPRVVGMDWGSATPFSIGWFAIADGETSIPLRGVHKVFPKGALIQFQEWYGVQKNVVSGRIEANVGIRMQSSDVGARMLDLENRMALLGRTTLIDRVADPSIFAEKDGPSIAEKFCDSGVVWRRGENKRISGWDTMRYMLHGRLLSQTFKDVELDDGTVERVVDTEEREPLLYFTENCEHIIRTLPEQERDMADWEDIDTQGEDHGVDSVRYAVMSRPSSGIKLSDLTRPAMQTECARDIAEATMSQGIRMPEDGLTRPQGAGGSGSWDDHIAGQNAYIAR